MKQITLKKNEVIFRQGAYETWMYDIVEGRVGIYANYGEENEKLLTTLEPGTTFGEMGMIECYPRSADAVALDDKTSIAKITADDFSRYFAERPEKLLEILQQMSQRIRELTVDYLTACKALTETVEDETNETLKTSLKQKLKKFLDAYAEAFAYAAEYDDTFWHYGMMQ